MVMRPLPSLLALAAVPILAGYVSQGPFPSLAPRPEEGIVSTAQPMHPEPVVADDAQLRTRIAALVAQAQQGMRAFDTAYPPAERAMRAAGPEGSDSWIVAQQEISRAEAARQLTTTARAELDRIAIERATTPTSAGDGELLAHALAEVDRLGRLQAVGIQRLTHSQPNR